MRSICSGEAIDEGLAGEMEGWYVQVQVVEVLR
jgi:hypothetical protein